MTNNKVRKTTDPRDPYATPFVGTYPFSFIVGGKTRKMLAYIPEGVKASTSGIYLFPPGGVSAEEFLKNSNWTELADTEEQREKMVLFVFESPEGGKWNLSEEYQAKDGDQDYLWKAYKETLRRELCCVYEGKRYFVGYQDGGAVATRFALNDPADIAGIVTVDAPPVARSYIDAATSDLCSRLHNFEDKECSRGIKKGDIPMHAWFISKEDVSEWPEVLHWRKANGDEVIPRKKEMNIEEYYRTKALEHPRDCDAEGYCVWITKAEDASADYGRKWNRTIWKKFLYPVMRWAGNPGGSFRMRKDPVFDLGMEYHYKEVDGWMREWYVHVPELVRQQPEKPVPLVFVPHGYTCSGEIGSGNANWYKVADTYGFIVIFPTALNWRPSNIEREDDNFDALDGAISSKNCPLPAWNILDEPDRPTELNFFLYMLEDTCNRFAIDRSRIYSTGTSHGNVMTQYLALKRPDIFAAIAPTSGILYMADGERMLELPDVKARPEVDIPIWMFGGSMEEFLLDAIPAPGNRTGNTIEAWWKLNRMPGEPPEDYTGLSTRVMDRWNDWIFEKDGIPMIRWTGIDYYPHAVNPEMSYRIWEEFFSKIRRGEDGSVIYEP